MRLTILTTMTLLAGSSLNATTIEPPVLPTQTGSALVGFEDIPHGGDLDFNDIEIYVTGVNFSLTTPFVFAGYPPGFGVEIPFPNPAWYFDGATAIGDTVSARFQSAQSDSENSVRVIDLRTLQVALVSPQHQEDTLQTQDGDPLRFFIDVPGGGAFSDHVSLNLDGIAHAVVDLGPPTRQGETPEPGALALCGLGLVAVGLWKRKAAAV